MNLLLKFVKRITKMAKCIEFTDYSLAAVIKACTLRGWIVNRLDVQNRLEIFNMLPPKRK